MLGRRPNLEKLDRKGDVAGLVDALAIRPKDLIADLEGRPVDVGDQRRSDAARRLAAHDSDVALEGLRGALADPSPTVRLVAIEALVARDEVSAAELLHAALGIEDAEARTQASALLAADPGAALLRDYVAADAEPDATFDDDWVATVASRVGQTERTAVVREAAATADGESGDARTWQIIRLDVHTAARAVAPGLRDGDRRISALRLCSQLRSATVVDDVIELIGDDDLDVRRAAVSTLGEIRHPKGVEALLRATIDDDYEVRDAAMAALDRFGTAGSVWGMATMARGVIADAGGWPAAALNPVDVPRQLTQPAEAAAVGGRRRRRWRRD